MGLVAALIYFNPKEEEAMENNRIFGFELSGVIAGLVTGIVIMALL